MKHSEKESANNVTDKIIYDKLFIEKHQTKTMAEKNSSYIMVPHYIW